MVSNRKRLATLFVLITLAVSTMAMGTFASQHTAEEEASQATSWLRVAHFGPDAPAVDVHLDNETVATNASFGDVTSYLAFHAGTYNVSITAAGDNTTVLHEQNVTLEPRAVLTVAASGELADDENSTFGLNVYSDNALRPGPNSSALRIVHLSPDAGAVTLTVDNGSTTLAENLTFGETGDYLSVAPGNYTVEIRGADGTVFATANVSVNGSEAVTAWAVGYNDPMNDQQPFTVETTEDAVASIILPTAETPTANATATPTTPTETETETVPTGTETATETAPTATETETESEPTGTETATETEPTPTETATESEPTGTETGTETDPTPTETGTATEPTSTETETETVPTVTLP